MSEDTDKKDRERIMVLVDKITAIRQDVAAMETIETSFEVELVELMNRNNFGSTKSENGNEVIQQPFEKIIFHEKQALDELAFKHEVDTSQFYEDGINLLIITKEGKKLFQKKRKAIYKSEKSNEISDSQDKDDTS